MCKFCEGVCACHINPPCNFCTDHVECDICGQQVCTNKVEEVKGQSDGDVKLICPDCIAAAPEA